MLFESRIWIAIWMFTQQVEVFLRVHNLNMTSRGQKWNLVLRAANYNIQSLVVRISLRGLGIITMSPRIPSILSEHFLYAADVTLSASTSSRWMFTLRVSILEWCLVHFNGQTLLSVVKDIFLPPLCKSMYLTLTIAPLSLPDVIGVTIWSMINTVHVWSTAFHSKNQHCSCMNSYDQWSLRSAFISFTYDHWS